MIQALERAFKLANCKEGTSLRDKRIKVNSERFELCLAHQEGGEGQWLYELEINEKNWSTVIKNKGFVHEWIISVK